MAGSAAPTRAAQFCSGFLEAGWLAALVVVPLYYNPFSAGMFDYDKTAVLRALSLLMLAAWLALQAMRRAHLPAWDILRTTPLLIPVALLILATLVSTALSIDARLSFFGSLSRNNGMYSLLALLVVALAVATELRQRAQRQRLVGTLLAASCVVSVHGIAQHFGMEPAMWEYDLGLRIISTLGNPIFAGAFLAMAMPLTLACALPLWQARNARGFVYAALLALQSIALWWTGSRGPLLAALCALGFMLLIHFAQAGRRAWAFSLLGTLALGALFLIVLNIPNGPLQQLRTTAPLQRLANMLNSEDASTSGRSRIWRGAMRLAAARTPIRFATGGSDALQNIRPLVGYGPETFGPAFELVYDNAIGRDVFPDRAHNLLLDALVTGGMLGLLATLLLWAAVSVLGLRTAGLLPNRSALRMLVLLGATGGIGIGAAANYFLGVSYAAPAFGLGLVAGAAVYCAAVPAQTSRDSSPDDRMLASAILGALAGHFVEVQVGIPTITTQLLFWVLLAVLFTLTRPEHANQPQSAPSGRQRNPKKPAPASTSSTWLVPGLISALVCATLIADFSIHPQRLAEKGALIGMLATLAALGSAALLTTNWPDYGRTLLVASGTIVFYAFYSAAVGALAQPAAQSAAEAFRIDALYHAFFGAYNLLVWAGAAAIALALMGTQRAAVSRPAAYTGTITALGFLFAAGLGWQTDISSAQAEMTSKHAQTLESNSRFVPALALFTRLTQLHPTEPDYWYRVGQLQRRIAQQSATPAEREPSRVASEAALRTAINARPFGTDAAVTLARLYHDWTQDVPANANVATAAFESATWVTPANVYLWNDWAQFEYATRGNYETGAAKFAHSLGIDPTFDSTHLAIGDMNLAHATIDPATATAHLAAAADSYRTALSLEKKPSDQARTHVKLAKAAQATAATVAQPALPFAEAEKEYALAASQQSGTDLAATRVLQGNLALQRSQLEPAQAAQHSAAAIEFFIRGLAEQTASGQPAREFTPWMVQRTIAQLHFGLGNKPAALAAAQAALALAPQSEQAYFEGMINDLTAAN